MLYGLRGRQLEASKKAWMRWWVSCLSSWAMNVVSFRPLPWRRWWWLMLRFVMSWNVLKNCETARRQRRVAVFLPFVLYVVTSRILRMMREKWIGGCKVRPHWLRCSRVSMTSRSPRKIELSYRSTRWLPLVTVWLLRLKMRFWWISEFRGLQWRRAGFGPV